MVLGRTVSRRRLVSSGANRKRMRQYARMGHLDVCYSRIDERGDLAALSPESRFNAERIMATQLQPRRESAYVHALPFRLSN